jgi:cbb3-type cytochrome oxidase subunit 3
MNAQTLPLKDIYLPDPIGLWPLAPGWWLLIILIITLIATAVWFWQYNRKHRIAKQQTRDLIIAAYAQWQMDQNNEHYCETINQSLKRYWRLYNKDAMALSGKGWVDALNRIAKSPIFTGDLAHALASGPYCPASDIPHAELQQAALHWLKVANNKILSLPINSNTGATQ